MLATVQLNSQYMSFPRSEFEQPPRHLRGYAKPLLEPGQTATVEFPLVRCAFWKGDPVLLMSKRKKDLSVWDVERQLWRVPKGDFTFWAGQSSRELPLRLSAEIGV